jgi:hypothetical protein
MFIGTEGVSLIVPSEDSCPPEPQVCECLFCRASRLQERIDCQGRVIEALARRLKSKLPPTETVETEYDEWGREAKVTRSYS